MSLATDRDRVERYRQDLFHLTNLARRDLQAFLYQVRDLPIEEVRDLLIQVMPELVDPYLTASGELAAGWYEQLRADVSGQTFYASSDTASVQRLQSNAVARWAVGPLVDGDTAAVLSRLGGAVQRMIFDSARGVVEGNVVRDPIRVGYQRMARPNCCAFCGMLASRGAVYTSAESAGAVVGRGSTRTGFDALGNRLAGGIGQGIRARGAQNLGDRYHDHCVVPGTMVSGPDAQVGYRRHYEGEVITLVTAMGNEVTITPNHPVLTDRGWVPAGFLHEGDNLVSAVDSDRNVVSGPHEDHVPARIEDVVSALGMVRASRRLSVPGSAEQFHGDGFDAEVDVVASDDLLRNPLDALLGEPVPEPNFHGAAVPRSVSSSLRLSLRSLESLVLASSPSSDGSVSVCSECAPFVDAHSFGAGLLRIGGTAERDARFGQPTTNDVPAHSIVGGEREDALPLGVSTGYVGGRRDASVRPVRVSRKFDPALPYGDPQTLRVFSERGSDLRERLAGTVHLDRLLDKRVGQYHGDVLNLETAEGWYTANGITVSNCYCVVMPVFAGSDMAELARADAAHWLDMYQQAGGSTQAEVLANWRQEHGTH